MLNLKHDPRNPTSDFLHRNPSLYDRVFEKSSTEICLEIFLEKLGALPGTLLDIGCGTGRDIYELSTQGIACVGVDFVPTMIEHAQQKYEDVEFHCGDLKRLNLDKTFDVVTLLGSCINYMLTNEDLDLAIQNIKNHCNNQALVIIEPLNVSSFIGSVMPPENFSVDVDGIKATGLAKYSWDSSRQVIERKRTWTFSDTTEQVTDAYRLRLILAQDLKSLLGRHGFYDISIHNVQRSEIYGKSIFVSARYDCV